MAKLARLKPGRSTNLGTPINEQGQRVENTADKLAYLRRHWAKVFKAKKDTKAAQRSLRQACPEGRAKSESPSRTRPSGHPPQRI